MARKPPKPPISLRQTFDLYEVIYSVVYGAIFGALIPDYLKSAHSQSVPPALAIAAVAIPLVSALFGLFYNARIRTGIFEFRREALTIVGPIFAGAVLCLWLYLIGDWTLLTLCVVWAIPYLLFIVLGPALRKRDWIVRVVIRGSRKK